MNESTRSWVRMAGPTVRLSALVAVVGIVFLVLMFAGFAMDARGPAMAFGWINDLSIVVMYLLLVPTVMALHGLTRPGRSALATVVALAGLAGIAWVVVWQGLLVAGTLTFDQEIGPVTFGYLALAIWFVVAGFMASTSGDLPRGAWMGLLGASYLGYPIWAIWIGRRLERLDAASLSGHVVPITE